MVLDTSLLNTQHYKVCIKGEVEKSRERSSTLLYTSVVAIEKGAFIYKQTPSELENNLLKKILTHTHTHTHTHTQ